MKNIFQILLLPFAIILIGVVELLPGKFKCKVNIEHTPDHDKVPYKPYARESVCKYCGHAIERIVSPTWVRKS